MVAVERKPPRKLTPAEDREIEYLICQTCTTPSYIFEMEGGKVSEAQCLVCGNEDPTQFLLGEDAGVED
jgi:translation initiation factor 2 beta subunit (eIF-2beta)/eIF-5